MVIWGVFLKERGLFLGEGMFCVRGRDNIRIWFSFSYFDLYRSIVVDCYDK